MKPCDICLEKVCKSSKGEGNCVCETCAVKDLCNKKLRATIRITLKCTQSCSHCCFESSPKLETHMSVETATNISKFLINNEVHSVNIMGGEVFCNPHWREILDLIVPSVKVARIVSNGDWAASDENFAEHVSKYDNCIVSLSKDKWHTNKNIDESEKQLKNFNVPYKTSDLNEKDFDMFPIGRSEFNGGLYSMFSCYCHNPEHMYSFLVDEIGKIYKCGFGVWDYATIDEYVEGGFAPRFKEFNKKFYDIWISNCSSCIRGYNHDFLIW